MENSNVKRFADKDRQKSLRAEVVVGTRCEYVSIGKKKNYELISVSK